MAEVGLVLLSLLYLAGMTLYMLLRRDLRDLGRFGPGSDAEDLPGLRQRVRGAAWRLPLFIAILIGSTALAMVYGSAWRIIPAGALILNAMIVPPAINLVLALGEGTRQQWARDGSVLGMLRAGLWSIVAFGLLALTVFWRLG